MNLAAAQQIHHLGHPLQGGHQATQSGVDDLEGDAAGQPLDVIDGAQRLAQVLQPGKVSHQLLHGVQPLVDGLDVRRGCSIMPRSMRAPMAVPVLSSRCIRVPRLLLPRMGLVSFRLRRAVASSIR